MGRLGDIRCPRAPQTVAEAKLDERTLADLALKFAFSTNRFTTDWIGERMKLSAALSAAVIQELIGEGLIEETMMGTRERPVYRVTERGRQQAARSMEVCAYLGPAPVSLEAYAAMTRWQFATSPEVKPEHVTNSLGNLVLSDRAVEMAGLAASSGRSLFVYGPSGSGKSSLGRLIHTALRGDIWVPYCISIRNTVVRLLDEQLHHRVELHGGETAAAAIDQRWVRVRRPMVVVGGELTLEYLDLVYSETLRYYEAPPHLKSNGGVFLVDDFGRERVSPHQLLNRFITPMEHGIDYFTLATGQKVLVPLRHLLIIATNLSLETVTDPAFLRRMGYRLYLEGPTPEQFTKIFHDYAAKHGTAVPAGLLDRLLTRYTDQERELRACEPRDLIERARDICKFRGQPLELTAEVMDLAWAGYFGIAPPVKGASEAAGIQVGGPAVAATPM